MVLASKLKQHPRYYAMVEQVSVHKLVDSANDFVCELVDTLKSSSGLSKMPKKKGRTTIKRPLSVSETSKI